MSYDVDSTHRQDLSMQTTAHHSRVTNDKSNTTAFLARRFFSLASFTSSSSFA